MNIDNSVQPNDRLLSANADTSDLPKINFLHNPKDAVAIQKHLKFMEQHLKAKNDSPPASGLFSPHLAFVSLALGCLALVILLPLKCLHRSPDKATPTTNISNIQSASQSEAIQIRGSQESSVRTSNDRHSSSMPSFDGSQLIHGNGKDWRAASLTERQNFCKHVSVGLFLKNGKKVGWELVFDALQEFYNTDNQSLLEQKIIDISVLTINASS